MNMKPHSVAIGQRYSDDSEWALLVEVDVSTPASAWITIEGQRISVATGHVPWLIEALTTALALVQGDTE